MMVLRASACAVGPDFVAPSPSDQDRFAPGLGVAASAEAEGKTQRFSEATAVDANWWRLFKSQALDDMVDQAVANSPTLQASVASLRQSQDNLRAGYGVFYPQIEFGFDASRQRSNPLQQGVQTRGSIFNLVTLSGTISYDIDIFGGERRTVEGLQAQVDYQRNLSRAAYLSLTANLVNTGIARACYEAQIGATEQLIELEGQQLSATLTQVHAGTAPYTDALSIRSLIAANRADLAPLRQKVSQAEDLLVMLEANAPLPGGSGIGLSDLMLPIDLPLSVPSELVRQRPDILAAEAQLHQANANIGVATATMFPSFSVNGNAGVVGSGLGHLSVGSGAFWGVGPSVTVPIFRGGSLWYGRKAAIDAHDIAQANYRQTVLVAIEQVADSLKALQHDADGLQAQVQANQAAREALVLVQVNYRAGMVAYLDVLAADVQFHQTSIAYFQAVAQRLQDTVALFVALGGGWSNASGTSDLSVQP